MKTSRARYGLHPLTEEIMRFSLWARLQREITPARVQDDWKVSRATAYRWIASWNAARGVYGVRRRSA